MRGQDLRDNQPYRSRGGMILGVCRGLADYFNLPVFWVRAGAVAVLVITGFWPVLGIYLLAAFFMKPEPVIPFRSEDEHEFYNSYASSRKMALNRLKKTFDNLDRRLGRMEDRVTAKEFDWERRLRRG
ncbi:MAG: envelope stress response membrane protein PspC [Pseudomonadota bacterium]